MHYIRPSHCETVGGVPDILYAIPEEFGAFGCCVPVPEGKLLGIEQRCVCKDEENFFMNTFNTRWTFKGCCFLLIMRKQWNCFKI